MVAGDMLPTPQMLYIQQPSISDLSAFSLSSLRVVSFPDTQNYISDSTMSTVRYSVILVRILNLMWQSLTVTSVTHKFDSFMTSTNSSPVFIVPQPPQAYSFRGLWSISVAGQLCHTVYWGYATDWQCRACEQAKNFLENKRPPYWIFISGFDFDHIRIHIRMSFCVCYQISPT